MTTLSLSYPLLPRKFLDFYDNFILLTKQKRYSGLALLVKDLSILLILKPYLKSPSPKLNNSIKKEPFNEKKENLLSCPQKQTNKQKQLFYSLKNYLWASSLNTNTTSPGKAGMHSARQGSQHWS